MAADDLVGRAKSNHDSGNIPGVVEFAGVMERTELPGRHAVCEPIRQRAPEALRTEQDEQLLYRIPSRD